LNTFPRPKVADPECLSPAFVPEPVEKMPLGPGSYFLTVPQPLRHAAPSTQQIDDKDHQRYYQ
jgi:hypothetical protein